MCFHTRFSRNQSTTQGGPLAPPLLRMLFSYILISMTNHKRPLAVILLGHREKRMKIIERSPMHHACTCCSYSRH
jgi:hypothetical protein